MTILNKIMNKILDGIKIGQQIQQEIKEDLAKKNIRPGLAVVLVGEDAPSQLYVSKKKKACQEVGIDFHEYLLDVDTSQEHLLETIDFLNKDENVDAILVQLPLPEQFDTDKIITALDPKKDVDGFHKENIKNFLKDKSIITPGLPLGVLRLIEQTKEKLGNKQAVIVSKGKIFSQPMIKILEDRKMKVSLVKPVIDIGINKIDKDYVVGDVDYSGVFDKVKFITPVPGGVGPMTIAMLLYNTVKLAETKRDIK